MRIWNLRYRTWTCALVATCTFAGSAEAADRPAKITVPNGQIQALGIQTAPLQSQSGSVKTRYPAQVILPSNAEQVVSAPLAGLVVQLLVQPNEVVRAGTPLIRLASPELGQLQLQLLQASSRATLARQAAQREQALFDEGIIPQRRVQETQAALRESEAALTQVKAALRLAGMPVATINRVVASGEPQGSIALTATRAGIVTEIAVKPGQRVEPATALLHVAQTGSLLLEIQLPASESADWPSGTRVEIAGRNVAARVSSTGRTISTNSQTVALRAVIEGETGQLRPGEFVTAELSAGSAKAGWDVPLSAVVHDGNATFLFVRTTDGFEARSVRVVAGAGQRVRVQGEVKAGEQIAVSGIVALKGAWLDDKGNK